MRRPLRRKYAIGLVVAFLGIAGIGLNATAQWEYVQAGFAAAGAIKGIIDGANTARWQDDTTEKLNTLIGMSQHIIDDLKQLRIDINKTVTDKFEDFVEKTLKADIQQFEFNLGELRHYSAANNDARVRINQIINNLERDGTTLSEYGPAAYQTNFAAILVTRAIYRFTGMPIQHQKSYFAFFEKKYEEWLQPTQGTPTFARMQEEKARDADLTSLRNLSSSPRSVAGRVEYYSPPRHGDPGGYSWCDYTVRVFITGDPETGYKTTASTADQCRRIPVEGRRKEVQAQLDSTRDDYLKRKDNIVKLKQVEFQIDNYRQYLHTLAHPRRKVAEGTAGH
jgi:hypothetical protein